MAGNALEWVAGGPPPEAGGPVRHRARGGGADAPAPGCVVRAATRIDPEQGHPWTGFRIVRSLP